MPKELIEGLRQGSADALARLITLVENRDPGWIEVMKTIYPETGGARVIGITGAPGSGKSTLVDQLTQVLVRQGQKVGIIAIDPSSPISGGALLGDRIRMTAGIDSEHIFFRSMSSRGIFGGLARAAVDTVRLMAAAGKDFIVIETVGVGQVEVDIFKITDLTIVVCIPNMGDSIQAIKSGILEIADIFVVNKSDIQGADRVEADIKSMLALRADPSAKDKPLVRTVATSGSGIERLVAEIRTQLKSAAGDVDRRGENVYQEIVERIRDATLERIWEVVPKQDFEAQILAVSNFKKDPYSVAQETLSRVFKAGPAD
jgi:LAO/AO transport system kinase